MIFLDLYLTFLKIGLFGFGGGYAMIPLMQQEILSRQWLTSEEFLNIISISQMTPGPIGINAATFCGIKTASILGGSVATLGVVTPSFLLLMLVGSLYYKYKNGRLITGIMGGVRPAVAGLIGSAAVVFARLSLVTQEGSITYHWPAIGIFCGVVLAVRWGKLNPLLAILFSAIAGMILL